MEKFYIDQYEFIENEILSSFIFHLEYNQVSSAYNLQIPSNPLIDIDILKLVKNSDNDISKVIKNLNKIINSNKYSNETISEIKNLKQWIIQKLDNSTNIVL